MKLTILVTALLVGTGCSGVGPQVEDPPDASTPVAAVRCGPDNCAGCCERNVCRSGELDAACGAAGALCATCSQNAWCISKICVEQDPFRYRPDLRDAGAPRQGDTHNGGSNVYSAHKCQRYGSQGCDS